MPVEKPVLNCMVVLEVLVKIGDTMGEELGTPVEFIIGFVLVVFVLVVVTVTVVLKVEKMMLVD